MGYINEQENTSNRPWLCRAPVFCGICKIPKVIGFDLFEDRISELLKGYDRTLEVTQEELVYTDIFFTPAPKHLHEADFHIVAVPTPINNANQTNLSPMIYAAKLIGKQLKVGDIVVFESTIYPGATEDECISLLERESGLD